MLLVIYVFNSPTTQWPFLVPLTSFLAAFAIMLVNSFITSLLPLVSLGTLTLAVGGPPLHHHDYRLVHSYPASHHFSKRDGWQEFNVTDIGTRSSIHRRDMSETSGLAGVIEKRATHSKSKHNSRSRQEAWNGVHGVGHPEEVLITW